MPSAVSPLHQHLQDVLFGPDPLGLVLAPLPSSMGGCFCATGYLLGVK